MTVHSIFISYRRRDAGGHARALYEYLSGHFGENRVFFDRITIESGDIFPDKLRQGVEGCAILLALIGPEWLDFQSDDGVRRLDDPHDFVRQEIALAFQQGKKVIPILFDGTPFPPGDRLPVPLKRLASCDPLELRGKAHEYDMQRQKLVRLLEKAVEKIVDGDVGVVDAPEIHHHTLKEFQRSIYNTFDGLRIRSLPDYQALAEHERFAINQEIISKMIALEAPPNALLDLRRINTKFPRKWKKTLTRDVHQGTTDPWDILHRNAAIYSDHSLVCIPSITIPERRHADTFIDHDHSINDNIINLLLQHRPLIEKGKMSIVPDVVRLQGGYDSRDKIIFAVQRLEAVNVDLGDPTIHQFFLSEGKMLKRQCALVLNSPNSAGLPLDRIMEIIDCHYRDEYDYFQKHLKQIMGSLNPEDDTRALRHALQAVDLGIQELEARYQSTKRKSSESMIKAAGAGTLAVLLYTAHGTDVMSFIAAAFAGCSLSSLVSFIPSPDRIPPDIRQAPFFIPWLIHHQSQSA